MTKSAGKSGKTRIQREKNQQILEAALSVFSQFGFRGSTIDQIAKEAGLSKPNLLYYFPSKEAIHSELLSGLMDSWLDPMRALNAKGDPKEEILSYMRRKLQMSRDFPRESRLFANEIIQGAPDEQFLTNLAFNNGLKHLVSHGLSYDLLIFENQLATADQFVANHPDLPMVLDHCAKPWIRRDVFAEDWANGIKQIAKNSNLHCKLSGLPTEIQDASPCTPELLRPYFDTVLEAFGPNRMMFGSDWPVSLPATKYHEWLTTVQSLINELSPDEQNAIRQETAKRFYRL